MKFATYKDASRDGQLLVVSRDLSSAHYATGIANKLQQVLEDWNFMSPQLQDLYELLNSGKARHAFPFEPARCMAPLPRSYQWVSGAAFTSHAELVHKAAGSGLPENFRTEALMVRGCGDGFYGPCDDIVADGEAPEIDFEAEIAVITGDVPRGASPEQALDGVRLLMLANDVSWRGPAQGRPGTAFSPVAITPDEAGEAWRQGRLHLTLQSTLNSRKVGMCEAGPEMTFHFGQLIAGLCRAREVRAGSIVGSGPVSNQDRSHGYSCIAEKRAIETVEDGKAKTRFMKPGDSICIEVKGKNGQSVFGAIEQKVVAATAG